MTSKGSLLAVFFAALVLLAVPASAEINYVVFYGGTGQLPALSSYSPLPPQTWMWVAADTDTPDVTHIAVTLTCTGRNETRLVQYAGHPVNTLFTGLTPETAKAQACTVTVAGVTLKAAKVVQLGQ